MISSLVLFALLAIPAARADAELECSRAAQLAGFDRIQVASPQGLTAITERQEAYVVETCVRSGLGVWGRLEGDARRQGCLEACRAGHRYGDRFDRGRGQVMCRALSGGTNRIVAEVK